MVCPIEKMHWAHALEGMDILLDEPMARHTSMRVGGSADCLLRPRNADEIRRALSVAKASAQPITLLGNGSDTLVKDGGLRGLTIKIAPPSMGDITRTQAGLRAQAGALLSSVARVALRHNLEGFACLAGVPGCIGGALAMNAGAYGGEIGPLVHRVHLLTLDGEARVYTREDLQFSYRMSRLQTDQLIALEAEFALPAGDPDHIRAQMRDFAQRRACKQPLALPSAGSIFKRPAQGFAAQMIDACGLKGTRVGGAQVSTLHAGFIVNQGGATASDVLALIDIVRARVEESCGVCLETEVHIVGEDV